jgi:endoglucanase
MGGTLRQLGIGRAHRDARAGCRTRRLRAARTAALVVVLAGLAAAPAAHAVLTPNPLETNPPPPAGNPLVGARWFVDQHWGLAARQVRAWRHSHPDWAQALEKIAQNPEARRYGAFTPRIAASVHADLDRAAREGPGTVPVLAIYRLRHVSCGGYSDGPREQAAYRRWIDGFARGVGDHRAVIFLEPDGIITTSCLSGAGLRARLAELRYAGEKLEALAHSVVYLDAGAADALSPGRTAHLLRLARVDRLQGFFLNSTHFDWTGNEVAYGNRVSSMVGGKHFVVSTAANGRGPLRPHSRVRFGNELHCNPPGRGLGVPPTTATASPLADAYMWVGDPGRSSGPCHPGDPPNGTWWPSYALGLARRAAF